MMDVMEQNRYGGMNEIIPSSLTNNIATLKHGGMYRGGVAINSISTTSSVNASVGKKIKGKVSNLTLKTETEDTCGDDFFSTHLQNKKNENQLMSR